MGNQCYVYERTKGNILKVSRCIQYHQYDEYTMTCADNQ